MNLTILGVGEFGATKNRGEGLKTFALGSCVALTFFDIKARSVAMAHIALPDSTINEARAKKLPGYFADTAIPALIMSMVRMNGYWDTKTLQTKLVGGANVMKAQASFNIGSRNVDAVRRILKQHNLRPSVEDVGGNISRTVTIDADTGTMLLHTPGRDQKTL